MNAVLKVKMLEVSKVKEAVFVGAFTAMAVYAPVLLHFFGGAGAGQKFLPMPFFVILAGILLGWRAGLITAVASPLISFSLSGMPAIGVLPFITFQLAVLGVASGILRKKLNILNSIAGAIVLGWVGIGGALFLFSKMDALNYVFTGIKNGLLGIAMSLIIIPLTVHLINKYFFDEKGI